MLGRIKQWQPGRYACSEQRRGYQSHLVPMKVEHGCRLPARCEPTSRWIVFTDEGDAIDGAKSGKYYAAVVIPESFSKDMPSTRVFRSCRFYSN